MLESDAGIFGGELPVVEVPGANRRPPAMGRRSPENPSLSLAGVAQYSRPSLCWAEEPSDSGYRDSLPDARSLRRGRGEIVN
jgi:hypothetical protein